MDNGMTRYRPLRAVSTLRALTFALITIALVLTGCAGGPEVSPLVEHPESHPWREDLAVFAGELERNHKNLFFRLPREEFHRMVVELDRRVPDLSRTEFEIELRKILAQVGDAHTNVSYSFDSMYPFSFYRFEEGVYCLAALPEYADALMARLIAVDGVAMDEVTAAAREITPHDNDSQIAMMTTNYLIMPELLAALGITRRADGAEFTFQDAQGDRFNITAPPVSRDRFSELVILKERLATAGAPQPLERRHTDRLYWQTYDGERDMLFIQYNACREDPERPMEQFARQLERELLERSPRVVLVDLRRNGGGDSRVFQPVIDLLAADYAAGREYQLFVAIGRQTFSSAVLNAIALERDAGARFVGEPSGGRPNHYGEIRYFQLPNLGRRVSYSTKYFSHYGDGARAGSPGDPPALFPDIPAPPSFPAYVQGRDPAVEAVAPEMPVVSPISMVPPAEVLQ